MNSQKKIYATPVFDEIDIVDLWYLIQNIIIIYGKNLKFLSNIHINRFLVYNFQIFYFDLI